MPKYHRVLLKLSGEILEGGTTPLAPDNLLWLAQEIKVAHDTDTQLGVVVGGGNILRGATLSMPEVSRTTADRGGMLATLINSIMLAETLRSLGIPVLVQSALGSSSHEEAINQSRARAALEAGQVVFFAGGTGNPYFSTDTAAVLRCLEIEAQVLLKGTKVDGLYTKDPIKYDDAQFIPHSDYMTIIEHKLQIMDLPAFALCRDNSVPVILFNIRKPDNLRRLLCGASIGTLVDGGTDHA